MDTFSKSKYLFWAVILLVVINLALLLTFWFKKPMHNEHMMMPNHEMRPPMNEKNHLIGFLIHELNLDKEQAKKLEDESKAHFEQIEKNMELIKDRKGELLEFGLKQNDSEKIRQLSDDIGKYFAQIEILNINHFNKIKSFLNKDQSDKLINVLKEAFERKGKGAPPFPGPPDGIPNNPPMGMPHDGPPHPPPPAR